MNLLPEVEFEGRIRPVAIHDAKWFAHRESLFGKYLPAMLAQQAGMLYPDASVRVIDLMLA